ncbi:MAG: alpha-amylase [Halieaceae bacterium]|nr:alpha-amylase [Halieaceae bacterium]|tara:strand:- start:84 stop:1817 length:1734 start_codon:yes stop_codon:yes gene_type:complete
MLTVCQRLREHLAAVYGMAPHGLPVDDWAARLLAAARLDADQSPPPAHRNLWDERDVAVITYGDSVLSDDEAPLKSLHQFLVDRLGQLVSWVHVLPFHPWTSDDGFSVLDYSSVNEALGDWSDVSALADDYRLMADLVLNHCSSRSAWFENFRRGETPGDDYFFVPDEHFDTTRVVRPRTTPLLNVVATQSGERAVWCTFSPDQVDFDFSNLAVVLEFVCIIRQLLDAGVRVFRLDAVAFLWKESGTTCMNLPQTHELIRLFRLIIESAQSDAIVITETNVPNRENLSYFGNANEAHGIYNFSLPPLLVHALVTGTSQYLSTWMMTMPPAQDGTVYFNFIASHDGIGLRPVEGLLEQSEVDELLATMEQFGGRISWRETADGEAKPYEMNIALVDALQGTTAGPDKWWLERFTCAHAIMLGLEGVPAFYIHSLLGTRNDLGRLDHTSHNRSINRHQWALSSLNGELDNPDSDHRAVFDSLTSLIALRKAQPAFHPNATQFTLYLGDALFGFWRQSLDRKQSLFCVHNLTHEEQVLPLSRLNLVLNHPWRELISETPIDDSTREWVLSPYQTLWITNT